MDAAQRARQDRSGDRLSRHRRSPASSMSRIAPAVSDDRPGERGRLRRRFLSRLEERVRLRGEQLRIVATAGEHAGDPDAFQHGPRAHDVPRCRRRILRAPSPRPRAAALTARSVAARTPFPTPDAFPRPRHVGPGPTRSPRARSRHGRHAGVHAGRNLRHGQGDGAEGARRTRRADRPRQHVPSVAASRRRRHQRARRPPSIHGLAPPDPHRFRRLSGLQPGLDAQRARRGRHVRLARQRRQAAADAGNRDGGPARARSRRRDGLRRMHALPCDARRGGAIDGAVAALGAALARSVRRARQRERAFRHRPGRHARGPARRVARGALKRSASTVTRSAGFPSASRKTTCAACSPTSPRAFPPRARAT